jgi:Fe2+ transport system protein FeoA
MSTLDRLKPGQKANIVRVGNAGPVRRRIAEMGVVRGTLVEVVRIAPLGDPIEVKVKGYHLSLRKKEAAAITVKLP